MTSRIASDAKQSMLSESMIPGLLFDAPRQ